jgi:membrane protein
MTQSNHHEGRGRRADQPTDIPARGWKDILWRVYGDINQNRIMLTAAGVTFYLLLSLVPTLTAFVSLYGLFNDPASVLDQIAFLQGIVPSDVLSVLTDQLTRLTSEGGSTLGWTLVISLGIALWSSSSGVKALFEGMNIAYHEREDRNFFVLNATALIFTFCGAVAGVLVIAAVVVMPIILSIFALGEGAEWLVRIGSYVAMLVVISLMIAALYRWGPAREQAKWRWITPGTLLSTVALAVGSVGFSWYAANFSDNNATYGSLGAVIGLMTWLWISVTLVLIGALLNAQIEHQTMRDTTTGERVPLGSRGAYVADTVGGREGKAEGDAKAHHERGRKRVSWGTLAFAAPAAAALLLIERKKGARN